MRSPRGAIARAMAILGVAIFMFSVQDVSWPSDLPENSVEGMRLFIQKGCVDCHAIQGQGGGVGPDLAKVRLDKGFMGLAGIMWNHLPKMEREFSRRRIRRPKLTEGEASRIMALIYSLGFFDRRADPVRGRELFEDKGCRRCHSVGGEGGTVGPPLDRFGGKVSPAFVTAAFWNRGLTMARTVRKKGLKWPRFRGDELADISAYLRAEGESQSRQRVYLEPGSPHAGRDLFTSKGCNQCHAVLGKGGRVGPDLGRLDLKRSLTQIAGVIWNHGPRMWEEIAKRKLDLALRPQEMLHLLSYLYFIQYTDPPGDPKAGRKVFEIKGCAQCHRSASEGELKGKGVGPDLAGKRLDTHGKVIAEMWNHAQQMGEKVLEKGMVWPNISAREMADLIAYVHSIQGRPSSGNR